MLTLAAAACSWAGGLRTAAVCDRPTALVFSRFAPVQCLATAASEMYKPPRVSVAELAIGQVVPCTVLEETAESGYLVDIGLDLPATLATDEIAIDPSQTKGDMVKLRRGEVYEAQITSLDASGPSVSIAKAQRALAWTRASQLAAEDVTYIAEVVRVTAAGATVIIEGLPAFLPWSHWHLDDDSPKNRKSKVGSELPVKFLEVDRSRNRLVMSRRRVVLQERMEELAPGQLIDGMVASLRDYGAVIRLADGLDGLLHVSQISQVYVRNVQDILKVGEKMRCVVIKVDPKDGSINLSTKMLESKAGEMVNDREAVIERAMQLSAVELSSEVQD